MCDRGELVLGQHCVVTPNSVVLRSAPPHSVVGGNPARVIERRELPPTKPDIQTAGLALKADRSGARPKQEATSRTREMPNDGHGEPEWFWANP